jgi:Tol biopolymer transport system component
MATHLLVISLVLTFLAYPATVRATGSLPDCTKLGTISFDAESLKSPLALSPDGKSIALIVEDQLILIDTNGKQLRDLTHDELTHGYPAWSPDGKQLVFVTFKKGYAGVEQQRAFPVNWALELINSDGSQRHTLLDDVDQIYQSELTTPPYWLPDGSYIAFGATGAHWLHPDGSDLGDFDGGMLSPDSELKVFLNETLDMSEADGGALVHLSDQALDFAWAPDSNTLAFTELAGGQTEIKTIRRGETTIQSLAKMSAFPVWSSNSKHIAYRSRSNNDDLFVMNADGSQQRQLTYSTGGYNDTRPLWINQDQQVVFIGNDMQLYSMKVDTPCQVPSDSHS